MKNVCQLLIKPLFYLSIINCIAHLLYFHNKLIYFQNNKLYDILESSPLSFVFIFVKSNSTLFRSLHSQPDFFCVPSSTRRNCVWWWFNENSVELLIWLYETYRKLMETQRFGRTYNLICHKIKLCRHANPSRTTCNVSQPWP